VSFITLDWETYYSKEFSLSNKMTTEEYIRDPRFEVIGVGIKVDDEESRWFSGSHEEIKQWLNQFNWSESAVLCHNTLFDAPILEWIFDFHPAYYYDTLSMARAVHGLEAGGSLAALVERYNLGKKGTEVQNALGKNRRQFSSGDLHDYGRYCCNDVDLTYRLFRVLSVDFPQLEFDLIDLTIKMFTRPQLMVDDFLLTQRLDDVKREKVELLATLKSKLSCETEEEVRKLLASNKKFAEVLGAWGVDPPLKISPTTGKETFAFSKTDEGFLNLQAHEDPFIQQLCAVRLGTKSTIEESRIERFIDIGNRNGGWLPIPLRYYGAHTGRWSGLDSVNLQNLPSRDKKKKALKNSIITPPGHVIINCDSSQIEARVLAWLAGQEDVNSQFANGEDVYSIFASKIYKKTISKANPIERFVGKTCVLGLGYGTGAEKLRHTLKTQPPGADLKLDECKNIVSIYRSTNYKIPELWSECDKALDAMLNNRDHGFIDANDTVWVGRQGIRLPNGLYIRYANLRLDDNKMLYDSRRGPVNIWGGAMVENIVQALARIIVGQQLLWVQDAGYRAALTVHDAGVWVVPEAEKDIAMGRITEIMSRPLDWCPTLPVSCEAKTGLRYGDC
jgi:DNA polymerase